MGNLTRMMIAKNGEYLINGVEVKDIKLPLNFRYRFISSSFDAIKPAAHMAENAGEPVKMDRKLIY